MTFGEAVSSCFSKYVSFSGRARRSEYWNFVLFTFLVNLCLGIVSFFVPFLGFLSKVFAVVIFLPSLAVFWRRMHDTGHTGLWWLAPTGVILASVVLGVIGGNLIILFLGGIASLVCSILVLVFLCQDSYPGTNTYGSCPK